jgi:GDPmannose 4,6-dehydratase
MLQQKKPDDYVIATGKQYSVKQFVNLVSKKLKMKIIWKGKGINEKGYDLNNNIIIECDKNYFRPLDVVNLLGDAKKSRKKLNWKPKTNLESMIDEMIKFEYQKFNEFK